jgi:hypothetical protein
VPDEDRRGHPSPLGGSGRPGRGALGGDRHQASIAPGRGAVVRARRGTPGTFGPRVGRRPFGRVTAGAGMGTGRHA